MAFPPIAPLRTLVGAVALAVSALGVSQAQATPLSVVNPGQSEDIGTFGVGVNTVSIAYSGRCEPDPTQIGGAARRWDCLDNNATQFLATLAPGTILNSVTLSFAGLINSAPGVRGGGSTLPNPPVGDVNYSTFASFDTYFAAGTTGNLLFSPVVGSDLTTTYRFTTAASNGTGNYSYNLTYRFDVSDAAIIPLPASVLLLLAGLGGLAATKRRRAV